MLRCDCARPFCRRDRKAAEPCRAAADAALAARAWAADRTGGRSGSSLAARADRGRPIFEGTLSEAEATLSRLREHQVEADAAEAAFDAIDAATSPIAVAEKLSAEGFGPRLKPNAADVLARLRQRAAGGEPAPSV
jgi:hypothetical protein